MTIASGGVMPHIQPELLRRKNEVIPKTNNKPVPVSATKAILNKPKVGGIQKAKNIQVSKKATAAKIALSRAETKASPAKKVFTFPKLYIIFYSLKLLLFMNI